MTIPYEKRDAPPRRPRPNALIIGGSVGGLIAAGLLRSIGWDVMVFERTIGNLAGRGAGLGISEELLRVFERIGVPFEPSAGVAHSAAVWMDEMGQIVFKNKRPTVGSTWPRVYQPLRDGLPQDCYRQGMTLVHVEQDLHSVSAVFQDGSCESGDLLVAADGVFSTVRRQFMPNIKPCFAGYVAWRGIVEECDVPAATREIISDHLLFCFPEGEMLLTMAVPGPGEDMRPGYRRIYFIWYRPASDDALSDLFTDRNGKNHSFSIPPPLIRKEFVHEMKAQACAVFAPAVAHIIECVEQPLLQAITDLESPRMVFERVAIMGDAAFVARPHTAGGVSKAALDAECLAASLSTVDSDLPEALARYERSRLEFGSRLVAHSRYLGASLESEFGARNDPNRLIKVRDEERIIRDYGAPGLLHDVDVSKFHSNSGTRVRLKP